MTASAARVAPYDSIAPIYDRLVGDAGLEPIWDAFRRSCHKYRVRFASVADIACGTGQFLGRLAGWKGPEVDLYGVDRSDAMLDIARRELAGSSASLLRQDMRRLELPRPVQLLTCNFNSIDYITEGIHLQVTVNKFHHNLSFNGVLIFDTMLAGNVAPMRGRFRQKIILAGFSADWDVKPSAKMGGSVVDMKTCIQRSGGPPVCSYERHIQRWWPRSILERVLARAGFATLGVHRIGDHRLAGPADRWVQFVARRR